MSAIAYNFIAFIMFYIAFDFVHYLRLRFLWINKIKNK